MDKNDPDVAGYATSTLFVSGYRRHAYTLTRTVPNAPPYIRLSAELGFALRCASLARADAERRLVSLRAVNPSLIREL
jgi:hypothetical protein